MTATFVITFDTELIWGSFTHTPDADFDRRYPDVRGTIDRILALLERHEVSATWAIVGHLFLSACERGEDGAAHPEMERPRFAWYGPDWYARDPCTTRLADPLWYGDDIVDGIRAARPAHEIASHSFGHPLFGDPGLGGGAAAADLDACVRLAAARGLDLRSFVFPRNSEGHHDLLRARGFEAYRGADPHWFRRLPGAMQRPAHLADQLLGLPPPVRTPSETMPGLWNVPGSMLLLHRAGLRRLVPLGSRLRKARLGLRRAVEEEKVFHLWTHPFNLTADREGMLRVLDAILREACDLRAGGQLVIEPMGAVAARAAAAGANGGQAPLAPDTSRNSAAH